MGKTLGQGMISDYTLFWRAEWADPFIIPQTPVFIITSCFHHKQVITTLPTWIKLCFIPGPSMVACMSVMSCSFTNTLIPSGGLSASDTTSLVTCLITWGDRFSTFESEDCCVGEFDRHQAHALTTHRGHDLQPCRACTCH